MREQRLGDRRVRAFLVAEAISAVGSWATFFAIWSYAAYEFDATAADITLFGIAFTAPAVFLGPVAGTAVDRFGPRTTLIAAKIAGTLASLALLAADDFRTLAVLSVMHGITGAFALPALQSMPPRLVHADDLARTNAMVSLTDEIAIVVGPIVGVGAVSVFGFRGAFIVDALTYLLGVVVLPLVHIRPPIVADDHVAPTLRQALEGWKVVARTPILRRVVLTIGSVHLLYGAALLAEPLYVRDVLHRMPETLGAMNAVFGIFLVGGGILVARLGERIATFGWVVLGTGLSGVTAAVYLGTPYIVVSFLGVAAWGLCTALLSGPSRTLLQRHSDEALHGRVLATDHVTASTAQLVGMAATGALITATSVPTAMTILGGTVLLIASLLSRRLFVERAAQATSGPTPALASAGPDVPIST